MLGLTVFIFTLLAFKLAEIYSEIIYALLKIYDGRTYFLARIGLVWYKSSAFSAGLGNSFPLVVKIPSFSVQPS